MQNPTHHIVIQIWFGLYTREARNDTCGFEHVFCGEVKDGAVTGLHSWYVRACACVRACASVRVCVCVRRIHTHHGRMAT